MADANLEAVAGSGNISPAHSEFSTTSVSTLGGKTSTRGSKKKRASKLSVLENRMDGLETKIDSKFDEILSKFTQNTAFHVPDNVSCRTNVTRRSDGMLVRTVNSCNSLEGLTQGQYVDNNPIGERTPDNLQENGPSGERIPSFEQDNIPPGDRRPILDLVPNFDDDQLSLHPGVQESRELLDQDSSSDTTNVNSEHNVGNSSVRNTTRFSKYVKEQPRQNLSQLFGEDENIVQPDGLTIEQAQLSVLEKSWRCSKPDKLSAYREESRQCFPIHEDSLQALKVPSLDDLLEPMISKKHGSKAVKNWGKTRTLYSQPLKAIEGLAYQGQLASRMGIISMLYLQQSLGMLLQNFQHNESQSQAVKDMYIMSTKILDQLGRAGAFHHLIRRKCASHDSGLNNLTNVTSKMIYLPLTGDGVFGSGLEKELKHRKDQKDQIKDLVPELNYRPVKRSFGSYNNSDYPEQHSQWPNNKRPRLEQVHFGNTTRGRGRQTTSTITRPVSTDNYGKRSFPTERNTSRAVTNNTGPGTFRIPKKQ